MGAIDNAAYFAELGIKAAAAAEDRLLGRGSADAVLSSNETDALQHLIASNSHIAAAIRELAINAGGDPHRAD